MKRIAAPWRVFKPGKRYWHCDFRITKDGKKIRIRRSTKAQTKAGAEDGARAWLAHYTRLFSGARPTTEQGGGLSQAALPFLNQNQ